MVIGLSHNKILQLAFVSQCLVLFYSNQIEFDKMSFLAREVRFHYNLQDRREFVFVFHDDKILVSMPNYLI